MPMSETTPAFRSLSSVVVTAGAAMRVKNLKESRGRAKPSPDLSCVRASV